MKKTFLVLFVLVLILSLTACREKEEHEGSGINGNLDIEILEGDSLNVYVSLPEDWKASSSSYQGTEIRHYTSPVKSESDIFSESVSVTAETLREEMTLEAYTNANIEVFKKTFDGFKMISEAKSVELGELDGMRVVYSYSAGSLDIVIDQTFAVSGGRAYMIMCNATADSYGEYEDIFTSAIESFKIN